MNLERQLLRTHQAQLQNLGWYSGQIDGISGVLTEQAFTRFKAASGLLGRPKPGPITCTHLWDKKAKKAPRPRMSATAPLLDIIKQYEGLREMAGPRTNSTILKWLIELQLPWRDDETPWCGITIGGVVLEFKRSIGVTDFKFDFNVAGAQQWKKFGVRADPVPGAIAPMWRGSRWSWKGHVIIVDSVVKNSRGQITHIDGWGGNQRNMISKQRFPIDRFKLSDGKFHFSLPQELIGRAEIKVASGDIQMTDGNEA